MVAVEVGCFAWQVVAPNSLSGVNRPEAVVLLWSRNTRLILDQQIADGCPHHVIHGWHRPDQHFVQTPDAISSVHQRRKE